MEILDWNPIEYTDGPYLYELRHRPTWPSVKWRDVRPYSSSSTLKVAFPVEEYIWESHLDGSLPEGARATVLARWLMEECDLHLDPLTHHRTLDSSGRHVAWSNCSKWGDSGIVVRQEWFDDFLRESDLECVWMVVGEREAWNDGDQTGAAAYRRFNRLRVYSNGEWFPEVCWNKDYPAGRGSEPAEADES